MVDRTDMAAALNRQSADVKTHVVVVDDNFGIRDLVSEALREQGFRVSLASDARELEEVRRHGPVDLIVLDIMMPGEDGLRVCRRIVRENGPPIVLLSARGGEEDRVRGLDAGASHYLPKPCGGKEIVATVRAALRRRTIDDDSGASGFGFAGWRMETATRDLIDPGGVLVDLTEGEYAALLAFVERPRRIISRELMLDLTRGPDTEAFNRAVDVSISRLRRKLRAPGDEMIRTIRNEGYVFLPAVIRL